MLLRGLMRKLITSPTTILAAQYSLRHRLCSYLLAVHVPRVPCHVVPALHHLGDVRRDGLPDLVVFGVHKHVPLHRPKGAHRFSGEGF